jgi:hypothetical protein
MEAFLVVFFVAALAVFVAIARHVDASRRGRAREHTIGR